MAAADDDDDARADPTDAAYQARCLRFEDSFRDGPYGQVVQKTVARRCDDDTTLEGRAFYDFIGRDDLADAYAHRRASGTWMMLGGFGVGLVGVTVGLLLLDKPTDECLATGASGECIEFEREQGRGVAGLAIGAAGVGIGLWGTSRFLQPHPASEPERRALGDAYNANLRESLQSQTGPRPRWFVAPLAARRGAGVSLRVRW